MKKRVLMIVNYFYPDFASTGQLMTEVCEELQDEFDITVIAALPSYTGSVSESYRSKLIVKDKYENTNILRVRVPKFNKKNKLSRIKYILTYFVNAVLAIIISGKQDLVFSISQPPILGGILGVIGKKIKRARLIYNIQDFNPEQIEAVNYSKNKFVINLAKKIDNYSCKLADTVLLVGRDMQQTLLKRFNNSLKDTPSNLVINNWIDESKVYPLSQYENKVMEFKNKYNLIDKIVFMYSGNIGLYYDLENIIKVIGNFKYEKNVVFAFVGEGAVKDTLINYCDENNIENVKFIPYQSKEELIYSLNAADIHIVTNAKGIKGVSVPSKIYGILSVDKLTIGILEKGTEARNIIEESGCGFCCEPKEYKEIENIFRNVIENYDYLKENQKSGRAFLESHLTKKQSIDKYRVLFNSLIN